MVTSRRPGPAPSHEQMTDLMLREIKKKLANVECVQEEEARSVRAKIADLRKLLKQILAALPKTSENPAIYDEIQELKQLAKANAERIAKALEPQT